MHATNVFQPILPDWHHLSAAIREIHAGGERRDHFVVRQARALAALHAVPRPLRDRDETIDCCRRALVRLIDEWVALRITADQPVRRCRAISIGGAVDQFVRAYVFAQEVLGDANASIDAMHEAWSAAGALATEWTDLVAEVVDGQPPPVPWPMDSITSTD